MWDEGREEETSQWWRSEQRQVPRDCTQSLSEKEGERCRGELWSPGPRRVAASGRASGARRVGVSLRQRRTCPDVSLLLILVLRNKCPLGLCFIL